MITRILLAVDDSPAALAATRAAIDIAAATHAALRAVHIVADHQLAELLGVGPRGPRPSRDPVLHHVEQLAQQAGIAVDVLLLDGDPARGIIAQARSWPADLIALGRSGLPGPGQPYVGQETRQVLEFADQPVLVVPPLPAR